LEVKAETLPKSKNAVPHVPLVGSKEIPFFQEAPKAFKAVASLWYSPKVGMAKKLVPS
jgi:hypothetical protein